MTVFVAPPFNIAYVANCWVSDFATIGTIKRLMALFKPAPANHAASVGGSDAVAAASSDVTGAS